MKRALITALICANVAVAAALVAVNMHRADAQTLTIPARTNYMITTCVIGTDHEAMLIYDSATQKLGAFRTNPTGTGVFEYRPIDLKRDFKN